MRVTKQSLMDHNAALVTNFESYKQLSMSQAREIDSLKTQLADTKRDVQWTRQLCQQLSTAIQGKFER